VASPGEHVHIASPVPPPPNPSAEIAAASLQRAILSIDTSAKVRSINLLPRELAAAQGGEAEDAGFQQLCIKASGFPCWLTLYWWKHPDLAWS